MTEYNDAGFMPYVNAVWRARERYQDGQKVPIVHHYPGEIVYGGLEKLKRIEEMRKALEGEL